MDRIKHLPNPFEPVAAFHESELGSDGRMLDTATILIANRECPFRCIYCDLWKHTLDTPTPVGAVPQQIATAFEQLGRSEFEQVKLYNAGNWFDGQAIPKRDHIAIADLLQSCERVVIENHPKLCDERVLAFRDLVPGKLEIALGVETVDDAILRRLDKSLTLADSELAIEFLRRHAIDVRAFLLFPPPYQTGDIVTPAVHAVEWCLARETTAVVLIPLRVDSGIMPQLVSEGVARKPLLEEIESVAAHFSNGTGARLGRVFIDLWDADQHFRAEPNFETRLARLRRFNETQVFDGPQVFK